MNDKWLQENIELIKALLLIGIAILFIWQVVVPIVKWIIAENKKKKRVEEERNIKGNKFYDSRQEEIEYFVDESIVKPATFGRKINWLAIKSTNHSEIVEEFKGKGKRVFRTNLESGVYGAYASNTFIYPKILDWIIVLNPDFNIETDETFNYLKTLSFRYQEVQFFGSFRGVGYSSWLKFINGETIRAYCVADGKIYKNVGKIEQIEKEFIEFEISKALNKDELEWIKGEGKYLSISDEENVLKMAERWSINPEKLDQYSIEELGTIIGT